MSNLKVIKRNIEEWNKIALVARNDVKISLDLNEINNRLSQKLTFISTNLKTFSIISSIVARR
jgi:hypothetical protein